MSYIGVFSYLRQYNLHTQVKDILVKDSSRDSVIKYLKCKDEQLVSCYVLALDENPILIVTAGDKSIDEQKYETEFGQKVKKINYNLLKETIGHTLGELCPFNVKEKVKVYLDESLYNLEKIYLLCGSPFACVNLTIDQLEKILENIKWINVCK